MCAWVSRIFSSVTPSCFTAIRMRSRSPPGSTTAALRVCSHQIREQFCSNCVTGTMRYCMANSSGKFVCYDTSFVSLPWTRPMPSFRHISILFAGIVALAGCDTATTPDSMPRELRQSSVVSTSTPDFAPAPGATLAWKSDLRVKLSSGVNGDPGMVAFIKSEVDRQLQAKGYGFAPADITPTFHLEGVLIMGDELNETQLRDALGFDPGLVGK